MFVLFVTISGSRVRKGRMSALDALQFHPVFQGHAWPLQASNVHDERREPA